MKYGKEDFIFSVGQIMLQGTLELKQLFVCLRMHIHGYEKGLAKSALNRLMLNISSFNRIPAFILHQFYLIFHNRGKSHPGFLSSFEVFAVRLRLSAASIHCLGADGWELPRDSLHQQILT